MPTTLSMDQIIKRLQQKVSRDGLTQTAKDLGMKTNTLWQYVNLNRSPSGENLLKLMNKLS